MNGPSPYGPPPGSPPPGGYDYQPGGYGDYGAVRGRSLKDYLVLLRERLWLFVVVTLVVAGGVAFWTFAQTPIYSSQARLQVLRREDRLNEANPVVDTTIYNTEDFNTQEQILKSGLMVRRVAERLSASQRQRLLAPYEQPVLPIFRKLSIEEVIARGREVNPVRQTLILVVEFKHPDPEIAATVANYFAEEYLNYNPAVRFQGSSAAVDQLKTQADSYREAAERIESRVAELKRTHNVASFETPFSLDYQELQKLNVLLVDQKSELERLENDFRLVEEYRAAGRPLWDLAFVAASPLVNTSRDRLANSEAEIRRLAERYRPKHPTLAAALAGRDQVLRDLENVVRSVAQSVEADFQRARQRYEGTLARVQQQERRVQELEAIQPEYRALLRDLEVQQQLFTSVSARLKVATAEAEEKTQTARLIDPAGAAPEPFFPNKPLFLALGLFGGAGLGAALVLLLAFFDDKVKSAFDIEMIVELPILGLLPRLHGLAKAERGWAVARDTHRLTTEAFLALRSTLSLGAASKEARVFLLTSTIPSEGKTFVSTNLAATFAAHGERTLIVDCDLRMPNVGRSLGLDHPHGVLSILEGRSTLDEAILPGIAPNCDALLAGGRTSQPTPLLSAEKFAGLVHELRKRYDRIVIDAPPLAPVTDALTILPLVDGVIFVVRYNYVRRKAARQQVRRLAESKVPILGAVLNQLSARMGPYYYGGYYDRSYNKYYGRVERHGRDADKAKATAAKVG